MAEDRFVGRESYIEEFDKFLQGDREGMALGKGQILVVVGREGIGKTALLQAMAVRAIQHENPVLVRTIDNRADLSENFLPLIAMIRGKKSLDITPNQAWLNVTAKGFAMLGGWATKIAAVAGTLSVLMDLYNKTGGSTETLAEQFGSALKEWDPEVGGSRRIVLILDSEKQAPEGLIPLLRNLYESGLPNKVRIVISQRPGDALINAHENREMRELCAAPMRLEKMSVQEDIEFEKAYVSGVLFAAESVRNDFLEKYGGWPLFMKLALEEIRKIQGQVREDDIRRLPEDIHGFWKQRYLKLGVREAFALVDTVCLLPHGYPEPRLAAFAGLSLEEMQVAWHDPLVWELLTQEPYENGLHGVSWNQCAVPQHATCRDALLDTLNQDLKRKRLGAIAARYREIVGTDLDHANVDADALEYYPGILNQQGEITQFIKEVDRVYEVRFRYGLFQSILRDGMLAMEVAYRNGHKDHEAVFAAKLASVYGMRGELEKVEELCARALKLCEELDNEQSKAVVYTVLGNLYRTQGNLDKAEEVYLTGLEIYSETENKGGMAILYGGLGNVYLARGELDKSEEMFIKALELNECVGNKHGMASDYGSLGNVYKIRGDLRRSEKMYNKALALDTELGNKEGMASDYGNLAGIHLARDELDEAEQKYKESLTIEKELGHKEGMVTDLVNLGELYLSQQNFEKAKEALNEANGICVETSSKALLASVRGKLGRLHAMVGNFDEAQKILFPSLTTERELGRKQGMAYVLEDLGNLYLTIGKFDEAEQMYKDAIELDKLICNKEGEANLYRNLGILYRKKGDPEMAAESFTRSLRLFEDIGAFNRAALVRKMLDDF